MKHLPLSVAGALFLTGSIAIHAHAQQSKEPMIEEQKPSQGSRQQQPQSKEGQGERVQKGESGQSDAKNSQDGQRTDNSRNTEDAATKGGAQDGGVSAKTQEGQRNQQSGDASNQQRRTGKKLEAKQRNVVKQTIVKRNVRPVKVNFSINVGAAVPRSVTLYDLPPTLIEYEPSYSGYKFILADDDTILVIDPDTWTIVDIIEV